MNDDLERFVRLARFGQNEPEATEAQSHAIEMAHAALDHCREFDDSTLRGLTIFIAMCRTMPDMAMKLLNDENKPKP